MWGTSGLVEGCVCVWVWLANVRRCDGNGRTGERREETCLPLMIWFLVIAVCSFLAEVTPPLSVKQPERDFTAL